MMIVLTELRFCRVRDVEPPRRAHPGDAGLDFFVPRDFVGVNLLPGESALIPSGVRVDVPLGWMLLFENKSGVASRLLLDRLACVVDHGYQGEVHLSFVNNGERLVTIRPGDKLLQGILVPVGLASPVEVRPEELFAATSGRGAEGFGSTGS